MGLPGADSNLRQKFFKKNKKKLEFWIIILGSSLLQDSLHFPLIRTLKSYFLAMSSPQHIANSRTRNGNLWFPSAWATLLTTKILFAFHKFFKKFSWIYKNGKSEYKINWNYSKKLFKYNIFAFINFSKNFWEYIRMENLSNKIAWNYPKNHMNTLLFVFK